MRSFSDNVAIALYKPGVFLYNHKTAVFIILGVLLTVFIVLSILYRRKKIFPLFVTLAVIVGLLLIAQIVQVSVKYKNDATSSGAWTEDQLHTHMIDQGLGEQYDSKGCVLWLYSQQGRLFGLGSAVYVQVSTSRY